MSKAARTLSMPPPAAPPWRACLIDAIAIAITAISAAVAGFLVGGLR